MPNVDQKERSLEDGVSAELFAPGCPEFTAECVEDEEDHGTASSGLLTDMKIFMDARDGVGVEGSVEVHGDLDKEDDGEDGPFLPVGETEAQLIVAVILGEFYLVILGDVIDILCLSIRGAIGLYGTWIGGVGCCEFAVVGGEVGGLGHDYDYCAQRTEIMIGKMSRERMLSSWELGRQELGMTPSVSLELLIHSADECG